MTYNTFEDRTFEKDIEIFKQIFVKKETTIKESYPEKLGIDPFDWYQDYNLI